MPRTLNNHSPPRVTRPGPPPVHRPAALIMPCLCFRRLRDSRPARFTRAQSTLETASSLPNSRSPWPPGRCLVPAAAPHFHCDHLLPPSSALCCHPAAPRALSDHRPSSLHETGATSCKPPWDILPDVSPSPSSSRFAAHPLRPQAVGPEAASLSPNSPGPWPPRRRPGLAAAQQCPCVHAMPP